MPSWLLKVAIHRVINLLPRRQKINELFQNAISGSLKMTPPLFELRLNHCRGHLETLFEAQPQRSQEFTVLELGTGWFPTLALGMYLCGASRVWTYDIDPLLNSSRLRLLLTLLEDYDSRGVLRNLLPRLKPDRMTELRKLSRRPGMAPADFLRELGIHYEVRDVQKTGLQASSVDLIFSHGVLLHIPPPILPALLAEFYRVGAANAVMSHDIDLSDVSHNFDRSITAFNFYKYSSRAWKQLDSPLVPLNRLRISDYRTAFPAAGWQINRETNVTGSEQDLARIHLAPEFQKYVRSDLLVTHTWLVARRSAGGLVSASGSTIQ